MTAEVPGGTQPLPTSVPPGNQFEENVKNDPYERLKEYSAEFADLVRAGANKDQLLNGANGKHGLNAVNEIFMMLPNTGQSAEFRIKE